ncbi:magnesium chelatase subunit D [Aestuariibius sp. 2305UL40-4]|uniref:magnesium chelatase subunit D n=1 Tax=Aestuariibius violaceus TaxID=3234132 RepID=UPI00345E7D9A
MTPATDLSLALDLLALDPKGLGGLHLIARPGPARDAAEAAIQTRFPSIRRLLPEADDTALFGGLDLSQTLATGTIAHSAGLLASAPALLLPGAERLTPGRAVRIAQRLDTDDAPLLIAIDESLPDEDGPPSALTDRLAFRIDLTDTRLDPLPDPAKPPKANQPKIPPEAITTLSQLCLDLGIDSLRAPLFALRTARALAMSQGRPEIDEDDLAEAIRLTLTHRITRLPEPPQPEPEQDQQDPTPPSDSTPLDLPQELLLEAIRATLPPDLLARLQSPKTKRAKGTGSGARSKGNRRGRPLPPRRGRPDGRSRIDVTATLTAAAPWQKLRPGDGLQIRPSDLRLKRYESKSDRLLLFAVDASGSAALARLAEAKGAIELLLGEAYARRDHVALIAFRRDTAELLLPPTRSLVQTKRRLAALPGGGGTPLASGLEAALTLARQTKGRGLTPSLILLTDGRANIALDGTADRTQAAEDAQRLARACRADGLDALVIDTGNRPEPALKTLAQMMDAPYLPLPRADAKRLSDAITSAMDS